MYHPDDTMSQDSGDLSVALDTLSTQDGTMPSEGDSVDVQVTGKVSRVDEASNCAYVTPEMCNGQPPPHMEEQEPGADLKRQAQEADDASDY